MRAREKMDDGILAEDIRRVAKEIGRIPRQDDYKKYGAFALNTILRRRPWNNWLSDIFGQINKEREFTKKVLDFEIMEDIRKVSTKIGKSPTQKEYEEFGTYPLTTVLRRKKWNEWLKASVGVVNYDRTNEGSRKIPDQELLNDVKRVASKLGHVPTRGEYEISGHYSSDVIVSRKPWGEFVKNIGEDLSIPKSIYVNKTKATNEELLEQLKYMAKELNRVPLKQDLGGSNGFSWGTYERAFGTFGNALVAAGLIDPLQRYCISRQELIDELKRIYDLLGHTPSIEEFLEKSSMKTIHSICSEFGSWTKALLAADIPVIKAKKVSAEDVKIALKKWYNENNNDNSCLEYWKIRKAKKNNKFPYSPNTISTKFYPMDWEEIMHECGFINYVTKDHYISGHKRGNHTGADGNEYLSSLEKEIGDLLLEFKKSNKIKSYEYEAPVCPDKGWTCDFKITLLNNSILWLEADGLRNNRPNPYLSGINEKIQFYTTNNMNFSIISYSAPNIRKSVEEILA